MADLLVLTLKMIMLICLDIRWYILPGDGSAGPSETNSSANTKVLLESIFSLQKGNHSRYATLQKPVDSRRTELQRWLKSLRWNQDSSIWLSTSLTQAEILEGAAPLNYQKPATQHARL